MNELDVLQTKKSPSLKIYEKIFCVLKYIFWAFPNCLGRNKEHESFSVCTLVRHVLHMRNWLRRLHYVRFALVAVHERNNTRSGWAVQVD